MIADGMEQRGHRVAIRSPTSIFSKLPLPASLKKWMGYVDQYLIFPVIIWQKLRRDPKETLFVFADQALGPWVPLVKDRSHVIHCHDFLAQFSANDEINENKVSYAGKIYQQFIRWGYTKGNAFISVSKKTQGDLHYFLNSQPAVSEVVYNGVNPLYKKEDIALARKRLYETVGVNVENGYLLHVGGNQWYKNRIGVLEIFNSWRSSSNIKLPLLMIGEKPDDLLLHRYSQSPFKSDIHFLSDIKDEDVKHAYAGANLFVFPSYAEGFGWPIAEAMACGCPVLTTDESPMTEVGGDAAFLIPRRPSGESTHWSEVVAEKVRKIINLSEGELKSVVDASVLNASRFNQTTALDKIEEIYLRVLKNGVHT
jgi:glycosyltransferase involved in cell wall biosynthesis